MNQPENEYCLTLISAPGRAAVSKDLAGEAARLLGTAPDWLAKDIACDLPCPARPGPAILAQIRDKAAGAPVDIVWQKQAGRRKTLLAADMDATIILEESLDILARHAGLEEKISAITAAGMAGKMDFAQSLAARMEILAGIDENLLETAADHLTLRAGAQTLTATLRAHGGKSLLLSGGLDFFASRIAHQAGFDRFGANHAMSSGGKLTGQLALPIKGAEAKREALEAFAAEHGSSPEAALAVGDGANDAAMLARAGMGVGFHAKPALAQVADVNIRHGDLTALLYLQGFKQSEFA